MLYIFFVGASRCCLMLKKWKCCYMFPFYLNGRVKVTLWYSSALCGYINCSYCIFIAHKDYQYSPHIFFTIRLNVHFRATIYNDACMIVLTISILLSCYVVTLCVGFYNQSLFQKSYCSRIDYTYSKLACSPFLN